MEAASIGTFSRRNLIRVVTSEEDDEDEEISEDEEVSEDVEVSEDEGAADPTLFTAGADSSD